MKYIQKFSPVFIGLYAVLSLSGAAAAASSGVSGAATQSFNAGASVLTGMVVQLQPKTPTTVIPLTSKDISNMLGIVIPMSQANIVITPQNISQQQVVVANSGRFNMLVSNQDGAIKTGDFVTVSSLAGIGMKADAVQPEIVGRATGNFDSTSKVIETVGLKGFLGKTDTVNIGYIPVDIYLAPNPLYQKNASNLPGFLTRVADTLANKPVSPFRVYLSAAVLLAILSIIGSMFYSVARNGVVALGRNPLAKVAIRTNMLQIFVVGLIIFIVGVFAVYLILNLSL